MKFTSIKLSAGLDANGNGRRVVIVTSCADGSYVAFEEDYIPAWIRRNLIGTQEEFASTPREINRWKQTQFKEPQKTFRMLVLKEWETACE